MTAVHYRVVGSPIGPLCLVGDAQEQLIGVRFPRGGEADRPQGVSEAPQGLAQVADQLGEYFAGQRQRFEVTLAPRGTPFQQRVWQALLALPFGETESYASLARRIGQPSAVRAVGAANGRNPIPIIIPCHRVLGADGTLTGFGGGLPTKAWLLRHEAECAGKPGVAQPGLFD